MKAYQIKTKKGRKFWTAQLPIEEQSDNEEVIAEETICEDFVKELSDEEKNFMILELAQMVRLNNVEEKLLQEQKKKPGKARKTLVKIKN